MRLLRACSSAELREAEKRKSEISGKQHRSKPNDSQGEEQLGKLGEEEDEEGEPAIERRRECTDLRLHLGEREEQVVCHASVLALAMTDEARREAEMKACRSSSLL